MEDTATAAAGGGRRGRHWISDWRPEDEQFWERTGRKVARRNLIFSIFAEHLGFSIWVLWSVVVLSLPAAGFGFSLSESFWLAAAPNLVGSLVRVPYTFAVPRFGGRAWTITSAGVLLVPAALLAFVVPSAWVRGLDHDGQFLVLMVCACLAGLGGGNFSSSMANISFFYPERRKGYALGLNAAFGNLGVALVQLVIPIIVVIGVPREAIGKQVHLSYAGLFWMPFLVASMVGAWLCMNSLTEATARPALYLRALRHRQTWVISLLYIGTFGSFIGFSFALPLVIKTSFPEFLLAHPVVRDYLAGLAFVGPVVGSLFRPLGGWLGDRVGGAKVTLVVFTGMIVATAAAAAGVRTRSFELFFGAFLMLFVFSGAGNGATYRMIPAIFETLGRDDAATNGLDHGATALAYRREAAAVIGIAGAVGAFGGFLVQQVFRLASASATGGARSLTEASVDWSLPALAIFTVFYTVLALATLQIYLRREPILRGVRKIALDHV